MFIVYENLKDNSYDGLKFKELHEALGAYKETPRTNLSCLQFQDDNNGNRVDLLRRISGVDYAITDYQTGDWNSDKNFMGYIRQISREFPNCGFPKV